MCICGLFIGFVLLTIDDDELLFVFDGCWLHLFFVVVGFGGRFKGGQRELIKQKAKCTTL